MTMSEGQQIGRAIPRVDGPKKVTGAAKYAAEYAAPNMVYGVVVSGGVTLGRIVRIDAGEALKLPGVVQVFTHENRPKLAWFDWSYKDEVSCPGSPFRPLYDERVHYNGQPVAVVVADTFELARYAATLVKIEYEQEGGHETDLRKVGSYVPKEKRSGIPPPASPRGDAGRAFEEAPVKVDAEYEHVVEHHNPMEMFATTAVWGADGRLTLFDKTQGAQNCQGYICSAFNLPKDQVRVVSPFVGGAFGSGLRPQYQIFLAAMVATELKRSVRLVLTRQQMFTMGYRPHTIQRVKLGADREGRLAAMMHHAVSNTSRHEDYQDNVVNWGGTLYHSPNAKFSYELGQLDLFTPIDMRAPGGATGVYALECAMDELAYAAGVDPLELRLRNYAEQDENEGKPFSSKELRECYRRGAERFGWEKRVMAPRSRKEGREWVGWGMATGAWEAQQGKANARAVLGVDGKLTVGSATADIGPGTYTAMTQIAAETLGVPLGDVTFELGDSSLPTSPVEGGSWTASTIGSAVRAVCEKVRDRVWKLAARVEGSPLARTHSIEEVEFVGGVVRLKGDPSKGVSLKEAMRFGGISAIEEEVASVPNLLKHHKYSRYTHSAIFVEARVDEDLGTVRVTRVVNAVAAGRIINPKIARSQLIGGTVWGIGMALHEETMLDHRLGRFMNHSLAEYHVAVNADIHDIDIIFVEEQDDVVNPLGVKGIGEIGLVGTPAAVANAVFHATGKRVRDLPITLDKVFL